MQEENSPTTAKSLIFVHGHHFKPAKEPLMTIWRDALRFGIERDQPEKAALFDATHKELAYFGDLTNDFLIDTGASYDERLDIADRLNAFAALKGIPKRKKFNRHQYQQLPGKTAVKEFIADVGSPVLKKLGLEKPVIGRIAPELTEYWNQESAYTQAIRERVRNVFASTMDRTDEIMVVAHCMGAVVTYDVLWELSASHPQHKIDVLLTLGCPLGNETVRKKLAGNKESGARKYPSNILAWNNISAEDDYVCHDKTTADDFRAMLNHRLISSINDFRIYNMSVRYGKSNPHSSVGYLIHPRVSRLVADWL